MNNDAKIFKQIKDFLTKYAKEYAEYDDNGMFEKLIDNICAVLNKFLCIDEISKIEEKS